MSGFESSFIADDGIQKAIGSRILTFIKQRIMEQICSEYDSMWIYS